MDSQFSFRRKYRLTTRSLQRARSSLSISFLVVFGLAAASASTYADDDHGRQGWDRANDQHWVGTWGTSPEAGTTCTSPQSSGFHAEQARLRAPEPRPTALLWSR
jgi:hypothetical protein